MASTEKLASGRYRGLYYDHGKKIRMRGTHREKKDALRRAQDAETDSRRRAPSVDGRYDPTMTWGEWCAVWWPTRDVEESTRITEVVIRDGWLIPGFGDLPMNEISTEIIQAWLNRVRRETSAGTAIRYYTLLRTSFKKAKKAKVLLDDPCEDVVKPRVPKARREHIEDGDLEKIKKHLSDRHREAVEFLVETGMRPGELCGLHRDHVAGRWVSIAESSPCGLALVKRTKTEDEREVPLTNKALSILKKWEDDIDARDNCGLPHQDGKKCRSDLVLRQTNGRPMRTITLQLAFRTARNLAGIHVGSVYSLRHTFGTKLAENNIDAFEIARLFGHATTKQSGTYVHRTEAAAARVRHALGDREPLKEVAWTGRGLELDSASSLETPVQVLRPAETGS